MNQDELASFSQWTLLISTAILVVGLTILVPTILILESQRHSHYLATLGIYL